jgi:uncharacterized surface protein with fasciclin (FAS1) repeats
MSKREEKMPSPFTKRILLLAASALLTAGCGYGSNPATAPRTSADQVEQPTIFAALRRLSEFSTLRRALNATALAASLNVPANRAAAASAATGAAPAEQGLTLLAPRDTGFAQLAPDARTALFAPENRPALTTAMQSLILTRTLHADELRTMITENGGSVQIPNRAGTTTSIGLAGDRLVLITPSGGHIDMGGEDMTAGNGAIYILEQWPR